MELRHLKYFMKGGTAAFFQSRRRARHSAVGAEPAWHEGLLLQGVVALAFPAFCNARFCIFARLRQSFFSCNHVAKIARAFGGVFRFLKFFAYLIFFLSFHFFPVLHLNGELKHAEKTLMEYSVFFSFFILLPLLILSCTCRIHRPCTLRGS